MLTCGKCGLVVTAINSLYYHLLIVHQLDKNEPLICQESSCQHKLPNWKEFRRYLINIHHYLINPSENDPVIDIQPEGNDELTTRSPSPEEVRLISDQDESPIIQSAQNLERTLHDIIFLFAAKLYADHNMPRSTVQSLIENTTDLVNEIIEVIQPVLETQLKNCNANDAILKETDLLFNSLRKPFMGLSSEYRRFQKFEETGDLIMPIKYIVGDRVDDVAQEGKIIKKISNVTATRIPMDKVLGKFLELPGVLKSTLSYMDDLEGETEIISNFIQCQLWQDKKKNFPGKIVLPLFLWFDDFEISDPLGSHKTVHKLGALYYTIPCLPPQFTSTTENIFVGLLFYSADRKVYGNEKIFQVIVKDINKLQEEGLTVMFEGKPMKIYFTLGLILGDNLGLNGAMDFVESFNANYYCRFCILKKQECRLALREQPEKLRKVADYARHVALGEQRTGVKRRCVWNKAKHHHVYRNPALCTLHDYFEGLLTRCMPQIHHHYIMKIKPASSRLSLDILNSRIKSFGYFQKGFSNAPPPLSYDNVTKKTISMSGSEMRAYVLTFSMLVGDLVPHDDVWRYYLLVRKIVDIVSARSIHREWPEYLKCLVEEHHQMYLKLFTVKGGKDDDDDERYLMPKEHLMTHAGTVMKESGPLLHLSTIRFESKNRPKKREAVVCNSKINLTYTLALKEQLKLCYRFLKKEGLTAKNKGGPGLLCDNTTANIKNREFWQQLPENFTGKCIERTWFQFNGVYYKIGSVIVVSEENDLLPNFCAVKRIFQNEGGDLCFIATKYLTLCFNDIYYAYEVEETEDTRIVLMIHLVTPFPVVSHYMPCGTHFVTLKHAL